MPVPLRVLPARRTNTIWARRATTRLGMPLPPGWARYCTEGLTRDQFVSRAL